MRTALFPGSFDPFHNGHLEIVETAAKLFDHVVVAPMRNPQKGDQLFDLEERKAMIAESILHLPNVTLDSFSALVVDLALRVDADVIVKGLRVSSDAEAELMQAQMNKARLGDGDAVHPLLVLVLRSSPPSTFGSSPTSAAPIESVPWCPSRCSPR